MASVKVRIAVAVDAKGDWSASGWRDQKADECMELAIENLENGEARYWLTAELDIPEPKEVTATVEDAQ